jgi:tetratricopeptide (TPR) repeat protein
MTDTRSARWRTALVVIARDEAPRLARLLESVAPWVDRMLVLDTGSTDDTVAVAQRCGAEVRHFEWCDDFAAARNAALDAAGADWHVVLDADEWLIEGGPALAAQRQTPPDAVCTVQRADAEGAAGVVHTWISRVLPGRVRYAGLVHEQPQHHLPMRRLACLVGHDGYASERLAAKRGRNLALLQAELAAHPDDAYYAYQLGKEHAVYDEHSEAAEALLRAAALQTPDAPWRHELAARLLYALKCCGRHAEGWAWAEVRLQLHEESPDFFFALGDLMLDWAATQPADGLALLEMAEAAWRRCLELGEHPEQTGSVQGRGSHLAAHNLAVICEGLGRAEEAAAFRRAYPPPG